MTSPTHALRDRRARTKERAPRHRLTHRSGPGVLLIGVRCVFALVAASALVATGIGWAGYRTIDSGITTSQALAGDPRRWAANRTS